LLRYLLQHAAAELGELADDLEVGVDRDPAAVPGFVHTESDGGSGISGPAGLPAAGVHHTAARLTVSLHEVCLAAELAGDRSDLHLDLAEVVVTFLADQLRTRHQRDHLLEIGQHLPSPFCRRAHGELVGDLHRQIPLVYSPKDSAIVSRSSGVLASAPRLATAKVCASSATRSATPSATRAATQSMVSATPGGLSISRTLASLMNWAAC